MRQAVDVSRCDRRQIRRQYQHLSVTAFEQHPVSPGQRAIEILTGIDNHRDVRGYGVALRTDDDDLTYRRGGVRSRNHSRQHRSDELQACRRRQSFSKPRLTARTLLDGNQGACAALLKRQSYQTPEHGQAHLGLPASIYIKHSEYACRWVSASSPANKSLRGSRGPGAGVRGIPSPFIKIYKRGRDTPHPSFLPLVLRGKTFLDEVLDVEANPLRQRQLRTQ